jgi:hypothetical protein
MFCEPEAIFPESWKESKSIREVPAIHASNVKDLLVVTPGP